MKEKIIQDVDLIHSNTGVLIGTVVLILLWLVLGLMERRGQHLGGMIARAIRKPLLLGLSCLSVFGLAGTSNRQQCGMARWQQCFKALRHHHNPRRHVGAEPIGPCRDGDQAF